MDRGAWWATVHGVAKSHTRLSDSQHSPLTSLGNVTGGPIPALLSSLPRENRVRAWCPPTVLSTSACSRVPTLLHSDKGPVMSRGHLSWDQCVLSSQWEENCFSGTQIPTRSSNHLLGKNAICVIFDSRVLLLHWFRIQKEGEIGCMNTLKYPMMSRNSGSEMPSMRQ